VLTDHLRQVTPDTRAMFTHDEWLVGLLLVNPAPSATSEGSFSSLYAGLKLTCVQHVANSELNHFAICHSHKDKLEEINLNQLLAEFVAARDSRATVFGNIDSD
jgi:hypothetical protein